MKKLVAAGAALLYLAVASAAHAVPEETGAAAGAQAGAISSGASTAVGIGALGRAG
ncbi:exopolysaccharide production protein YjbE, partial [Pantoea eucrina]|uniref:exopolysaccharide production protein YjbE n=1 Tax=Pantoea eucrina TaxID=472693 RepID=UPI001FCE14A3